MSSESLDPTTTDLPRRALLRGAALGGAALWAVPAVQVISMTGASAVMTSGGTTAYDDLRTEADNTYTAVTDGADTTYDTATGTADDTYETGTEVLDDAADDVLP